MRRIEQEPQCECPTCIMARTGLSPSVAIPSRRERRQLREDNKSWPTELRLWPRDQWPPLSAGAAHPVECWRSKAFLVQIFSEREGIERLSINRTTHNGERFDDGISWDDLQRLKRECGRGDRDAVEIFPADTDTVNVANMRHLWVLPAPLTFAWRNKKGFPTLPDDRRG